MGVQVPPRSPIAQNYEDRPINNGKHSYQIVPDNYRDKVFRKNFKRSLNNIHDPMVISLLEGKTILLDVNLALGSNTFPKEIRTLYSFFNARGYRLRMHVYDDLDNNIIRGILAWIELLVEIWYCSRCDQFTVSSEDIKPANVGCSSDVGFHSWGRISKMHRKRIQDLKIA